MMLAGTLSLFTLLGVVTYVQAHGHMIDPISRSSLHNFGYDVPFNNEFLGLDCKHTFDVDDGKQCGICGDPYDAPVRDNEAGGKYAKGIITRNYTAGQVIDIKIDITVAHYGGWSEFRICPNNDPSTAVTQACLNEHLLSAPDGRTRMYHSTTPGIFTFHLQLPPGLTCTQCVIQWTWKANSNNNCNLGRNCCVACGVQQHFRNCADVAISGPARPTITQTTHSLTSSTTTSPRNNICEATPTGRQNYGTVADQMCRDICSRGPCSFLMCTDACRHLKK